MGPIPYGSIISEVKEEFAPLVEFRHPLSEEELKLKRTNSQLLLETEGVSFIPTEGKFHIFLVWVGEEFPIIYLNAFETILFHHQNAQIIIFSNELDERIFGKYIELGYDIQICRFDLMKWTDNYPGHDFAINVDRIFTRKLNYRNLKLTHVHISDFVRYFALYRYGGLYMDTDMLVLKSLDYLTNTIGVDELRNCSLGGKNKIYNSKGKTFGCLCVCLMSFEKQHPLMKDALENYNHAWETVQGYGPGGAPFMLGILENHLDNINVIYNSQFICLDYYDYFRVTVPENDPVIDTIIYHCYVVHFFGGGKKKRKI